MKYSSVTLIFILLTICSLSCKNKKQAEKSFEISSKTEYNENSDDISLSANNQKPEGVTYNVSDVEIASDVIALYDAQLVFEAKIGKSIRFIPEEFNGTQVAPCIDNGLINIIQECYDNHRPLVLTPDVVWLTICQGVSIHINENYDSLKNILFTKDKPDKLQVRNDSLEYGAKHWGDLLASFSQLSRQYTKQDYYSFFVSEFSTTTAIHKTAYEITLLESYKKGFEYVGDTGCGIPYITLTGKKEDWQIILSKLDQLDKFGLSVWGENLKPIIQQFINVFDNNIDEVFWQSLYKDASEYAAFYLSGWIIKFFPYIKVLNNESIGDYEPEHGGMRMDEMFIRNPYMEGSRHLLSTLSTDNFPSGLSQIEIVWNNYFTNKTSLIEIYTGIMAIKQYNDKSLEPIIAWAACDKEAQPVEHNFAYRERLDYIITDYWCPHIIQELTDSAIYNHRQFSSQYESLSYIQHLIQDSLSSNVEFKNISWNESSIDFTVLVNGDVENIEISGIDNKQVQSYVKQLIHNLPDKWLPALTFLPDALDVWDITEEEKKLKIKVNSNVHLTLFHKENIVLTDVEYGGMN